MNNLPPDYNHISDDKQLNRLEDEVVYIPTCVGCKKVGNFMGQFCADCYQGTSTLRPYEALKEMHKYGEI